MLTLLFLFIFVGILLAGLSVPLVLRKVPPNTLYGFRTPATLSNEQIWYDVNEFGAWRMLACGIAIFAASFVYFVPGIDTATYGSIVGAVAVIGVALMCIQSFWYLHQLKSKQQNTK